MAFRHARRRWPATVLALSRPVLGAMTLSVAGLALFRRCVSVAALRPSAEAVGNYLQTVGAVYSVLLAFVVFVVWQQFNDARAAVESEATEAQALARFNDLADARSRRLTASRTRIPTAMRILLYTGACIIVASMWLLALDDVAMHATITAAMAGAVSHILYLVEDLDDAFDGDWQVSADPLRRASTYLATARMGPPTTAPPPTAD